MWWLVALGALTAAGIWGNFRFNKRLKIWEKTLESCGFEVEWRSSLQGIREACGVRAGAVAIRIVDSSGGAVVVVPAPQGLSDVVSMRYGVYRPPELREFQTGDELFDSQIWVSGPVLLNGLLDAETRRLLLGLYVGDCLEIIRGEIQVQTSDENLQSVLPLTLALGRRLNRSANVARLLSENARKDPEAGVRLQNLLLLIRERPGEPPTLVALRKACSDPAPEVRLQAAMALGGGHSDVLVELAENLADDKVSAEALSALDHALPFERTRAILDRALDRSLAKTACACLEALGKSGDPAAVDLLAE